jgi:ATP-dependent Lhr-like helicase
VTVLERTEIAALPEPFARWFASRGWTPRAHQLELLAKARAGRSVLLIAPTGAGKTLAGFLPSLVELSVTPPLARSAPSLSLPRKGGGNPGAPPNPIADTNVANRRLVSTGRDLRREGGLHTLYISPLKALAVDVARNLERPVAEMKLSIRIETRTGDTPASKRQRQRRDPPHILLTTPEQLALILASPDAPYLFGSLRRVVLDELRNAAISFRLAWRGCSRWRRSSPRSASQRRSPSPTICAASWCRSRRAGKISRTSFSPMAAPRRT